MVKKKAKDYQDELKRKQALEVQHQALSSDEWMWLHTEKETIKLYTIAIGSLYLYVEV